MFFVYYAKRGADPRQAPDHLPLQWRPGLVDGVAAYGRVRAEARGDGRRHPHARCALSDSSTMTRRCSTRAISSSSTRPATGFQPHRRQGQGEGVLRRRPGRAGLRDVHPGIPLQIQPLEFAQISVRRKLWHAAFGRRRNDLETERERRPERRDPALADPELRSSDDGAGEQSGHRSALCSSRCRPMRRPPGITTSSGQAARRSRGLRPSRRAFRDDGLRAGAARRLRVCRRSAATQIAEKLHEFTGLPVWYILKANLRIDGGEFEKNAAGRQRPDDRPPRHALLRAHDRSLEQGIRLRSAIGRHQLGLYLGVQRLCAQRSSITARARHYNPLSRVFK